MKTGRFARAVPALIPLVVVTAIAEIAVRAGWVRAYLVPAPSSVLQAMIDSRQELLGALLTTSSSDPLSVCSPSSRAPTHPR